MSFKTWGISEVLTSSDLNTVLSNQVLATFVNAAARDAAIPAPAIGRAVVVNGVLQVWDGATWTKYGGLRSTEIHAAPPTVSYGPDVTAPFTQQGHNVQLTDASHQGIIVFPTPFAAPPQVIHITDLTGSASVQYQFSPVWSTVTASQMYFVVRDHSGNAVVSSTVRCCWSATGRRN